ncbi:MAG: LysM peptidoglycan-binding domain-containing protein [Nitrospinae bacterium]|nr:LysM peptidoglycan-binding domain-containing protein [Nitrospinota bacterium]
MQNRRIVTSLFWLLASGFWLLASGFWLLADTASAEEISQKEIVKTPKVHIVREKDTLWDISKKYLNNPFKWEEVWNKNKFIANPHRIYPGDNIVIPEAFDETEVEKEVSVTAEPQIPVQSVEEKEVKEIDEDIIPPLPLVALQPPPPPPPEKIPLTTVKVLASAGYIIQKESEKGIIFDSPETRTIFGIGDTVYINIGGKEGVKAGDRFTIYKSLRSVTHPITAKNIGTLIEILGELEVTEVREDSSTANIIESFATIEIGNKLKEREDMTVPMIDPAAKIEPKDIKGYIIDAKDQRDTAAAGDIVYIDVGIDTGVSAGDRFDILKSEGKIEKEAKKGEKIKVPKVVIGNLQVIKPKEKVSTAIISGSRKEITIGEMIEYQK